LNNFTCIYNGEKSISALDGQTPSRDAQTEGKGKEHDVGNDD